MKKQKIIFIINLILFMLIFKSKYTFAFDYAPYEGNKNFRFSVNDINSEKIQELYNPEDTKIPDKFSLKNELKSKYNIEIPVGNQLELGLCDTFATVKCAETNYALKTGKYIDISERYLDYMTSKDFFHTVRNAGEASFGPDVMTILETFGAPTEKEVPYRDYNTNEYDKLKNANLELKVTSTIIFPNIKELKDDDLKSRWIDVLKIHIMKYGSINMPICAPVGNSFNEKTNSYYFKEGVTDAASGHAISIVGWDDNFSKDNFLVTPEYDGAFICLNSYGKEFGEEGYFYISYYSDDFIQLTGVINTEVPKKYNKYNYCKNLFSTDGFIPREQKENKFFGMKFVKNSENEFLSHITIGAGVNHREDYETTIKFYLNNQDDSFDKNKMILLGETTSITSGSSSANITLDKPVRIKGDNFSIIVEINGSFENILDKINFALGDKLDNEKESIHLYSTDKLDGNWELENSEFPIYAFTINKNIEKIELKQEPTQKNYTVGEKLNLDGGKITVIYDDNTKEEIEMLNKNVTVTGFNSNKLGEQIITIEYYGKKVEFSVNVKDKETNDDDDNTITNKIIPDAGEIKFSLFIGIVVILTGIGSFIMLKKYNFKN